MVMNDNFSETAGRALDRFQIELPSWGFANTGTRFGKFVQPASASSIEEKFSDAGCVHSLTGACPTMALHAQWDLPRGLSDVAEIQRLAQEHGVRAGSIHPNLFQNQEYKFGSLGNPDSEIRHMALDHIGQCIAFARELKAREVSLWFADGSNYPGTQNFRRRVEWFEEGLRTVHSQLPAGMRLLVEYKPFEPAFYHTDIADWGMALLLAKAAGPQARVLVDTGHHYQAQNVEQIVAWLFHHRMLGGFHFNDRRYADDDLTLGSIDPYQIFRIFHEILTFERETGEPCDVSFMVDQSHNLKGKIEATIQTVCTAQELYVKAALVDRERLAELQHSCSLVDAEELLRGVFWQDVRPLIREWRQARGLPEDPIRGFRESGYLERITRERQGRNRGAAASYA
jgi:L-rhamnose isomerase/sugar isomerase